MIRFYVAERHTMPECGTEHCNTFSGVVKAFLGCSASICCYAQIYSASHARLGCGTGRSNIFFGVDQMFLGCSASISSAH